MITRLGQVAGQKALITLINLTNASEALVTNELELVKNNSNLAQAYCTLSPDSRKKSIIYRAIKHLLKISHYYNNRENTEDVVSEALFLFKDASIIERLPIRFVFIILKGEEFKARFSLFAAR